MILSWRGEQLSDVPRPDDSDPELREVADFIHREVVAKPSYPP